ncbi:MAG TPA: thiamine pyrophosphate-binding protein [Chloroflexota bacterium]|nr:thiamine pyrophosphate-binding protein [Chloroflexota bacterium]
MGEVNGAKLLAQSLRVAGARSIFTLSGNQILPIYDAGLDAGLHFIDTRHESPAASMADAWGRLTGQPGVCLVTGGPGVTNVLTGLATALFAESPLLCLAGGTDRPGIGKGGFQELDQVALTRPVCKAAWSVARAEDIPNLVARAWRTAVSGVPGPVHLTLPYDVLLENADASRVMQAALAGLQPWRHEALTTDVEQALDRLVAAERPLVLANASAWRADSGRRLRRLLELTRIPGLAVDSPRGLVDPLLQGLAAAVAEADVVLLLGPQDFTVAYGGPPVLAADVDLIQVHPEAGEVARNRAVAVGLVGDFGSVLQQLLECGSERVWNHSAWASNLVARRAANRDQLAHLAASEDTPIHPLRVIAEVRTRLTSDDCVVMDGGEFGQWARWGLADSPATLLTNGKLGGIGASLSLAMGAALARPGGRAIACMGDGTFGFHGLEFDTAVRHGIPVVAIIGNDAAWGTERHRQIQLYGPDRLVASDLLPQRYDRMAAALGAHGEYVARPEEIGSALDRALASGKPACVNVAIASAASPAIRH